MFLDTIIGRLEQSERNLAEALLLVSDRHDRDAEIRDVARTIAAWSDEHAELAKKLGAKYGTKRSRQPNELRAALFRGPRLGGLGLVEDLHDLGLLAHDVYVLWLTLRETARGKLDVELQEACDSAMAEVERQQKWILAQLKLVSPQAIGISAVKRRELAASVPRPLSAPALRGALRGLRGGLRGHVATAAALVAVVGAGLVVRSIRAGTFSR